MTVRWACRPRPQRHGARCRRQRESAGAGGLSAVAVPPTTPSAPAVAADCASRRLAGAPAAPGLDAGCGAPAPRAAATARKCRAFPRGRLQRRDATERARAPCGEGGGDGAGAGPAVVAAPRRRRVQHRRVPPSSGSCRRAAVVARAAACRHRRRCRCRRDGDERVSSGGGQHGGSAALDHRLAGECGDGGDAGIARRRADGDERDATDENASQAVEGAGGVAVAPP